MTEFAAVLAEKRLMPLGPGTPNAGMRSRLEALRFESKQRDFAQCCLAGAWLYHDFLDESHAVSQEIETPEGSFWHAIMHRREPDAWNSKYWFRRIGNHPVLEMLLEQAPAIGYKYTNPLDFVDFCEKVRDTGSDDEDLAKRVQLLEWQLLFAHCFEKAKI